MPYAVTLRLDAASAAPVEAMWRALAGAGLHDDSLRLGYPPHVTLTIHPDGVDAARLAEVVARVALGAEALPLRFAGFGVFAAPAPVLYLAPVVTPALLLRQQAVADAVSDLPSDPHYRAGVWVPHVTLAKGGGAGGPGWTGRALDCLAPLWSGLRPGHAASIDLVHFRPVTVMQAWPLPPWLACSTTSV
jgi:2'-5' RNA ligase